MALILVVHDTEVPALYGAAAAALATRRQCRMMHLPAAFDTNRHADAGQHVLAGGGLAPSGLIWYERLSGRQAQAAASVDEIIAAARAEQIAVPVHPAFLAEAEAVLFLREAAERANLPIETIEVTFGENTFRTSATPTVPLAFRDPFGRISLVESSKTNRKSGLAVGLVGAESDHRNVYPAALASLADAADYLAIDLDVHFIDPRGLTEENTGAALKGVAGVLLPGGAAMENVPGQIEAAAASLGSSLPTVGLCLGMQTMVTAIAWRAFGRGKANLAEADPHAEIRTFVPMAGMKESLGEPLPDHRTGEQMTRILRGTRLSAILPMTTPIRYNHRFLLAPEVLPALKKAGLQVSAEAFIGAITDAIEDREHPFFIGMQGHPEQGSAGARPHPLLTAFLTAAMRMHSKA